jgi:uncharacterized phage protein (TIGR02218 family)
MLSAIAFCWRIERRDGAGLALTSHDRPLTRDGETYAGAPGMLPAAVVRELGLEPQSGEVAGALTSDAITELDLALGRWDGARVNLFAINWTVPDGESTELIAGELGEVEMKGTSFSAELSGAASRLNEPVCPTTSPECRARFGDKKCRVDLAGRSVRATVESASGTELQLTTAVDERFVLGRLRFLSGANCGLATTIVGVSGTAVRVRDLPRGAVEAGCAVELREGCDKRFGTCIERFGNAANFRGEPHLPGNDLLTRYPGA